MNNIFSFPRTRLAIYELQTDNGAPATAQERFTQLLTAGYHPRLTETTSFDDNNGGIQSITLVELPTNEVEAFQSQQLADEQRWGKPLTYFEFAKLNPQTPIKITYDDYQYMLCVLPPVYGNCCFAMGEVYSHSSTDQPIYYWAAKRGREYFCFLGTQAQAENEFAPPTLCRTDIARLQELIEREDIEHKTTATLERVLSLCAQPQPPTNRPLTLWDQNKIQFPRLLAEILATGAITPDTRSALLESMDLEPHQLEELFTRAEYEFQQAIGNKSFADNLQIDQPEIVWTKPLTPAGPESDPAMKLHGTVEINGISFHAEAFEVSYTQDNNEQVGKQNEDETYLGEICNIVQGAAETINIAGREYVFAIMPGQR
jgi:hypothetical protein